MKLSKRLLTVASFVPDNSNLIDVGCDHALLDIYLMKNLKNIKILATDINENPLKIARNNIEKYNLQDKIELKQMNGIENIPSFIDTIVISGMGGILITDILKKEKLKNVKTIILAPNNEFTKVRCHLKKINFYIEKEQLIIDDKKTYLILLLKKGKRETNPYFGTLKNNNLETIYYYTNILNTNLKILKNLPRKYLFKRIKLKLESKKIKRFLNKTTWLPSSFFV